MIDLKIRVTCNLQHPRVTFAPRGRVARGPQARAAFIDYDANKDGLVDAAEFGVASAPVPARLETSL